MCHQQMAEQGSQHDVKTIANSMNRKVLVAKAARKFKVTTEGWLYLAVIIDLYSPSVTGWPMSIPMINSLVCDALQMLVWRRGMPKGALVRSDRGSQYCSHAYRDVIHQYGLVQRMSHKGSQTTGSIIPMSTVGRLGTIPGSITSIMVPDIMLPLLTANHL